MILQNHSNSMSDGGKLHADNFKQDHLMTEIIKIVKADLNSLQHTHAIIDLLNAYASGQMGGNHPLTDYVKENLIGEFKKRSTIQILLAFVGSRPAGLAICIEGFSTFSCQPLLNIHDLAVAHAFQGRGIGRKLVEHVANLAKELGCCKVTLEVLDGNTRASDLYKSCGFANYALSPEMGTAMFMQRMLS